MNCFEARQEFSGLWRGALSAERRAELLTHLSSCARCDHGFRIFALTAPVLHSESEPASRLGTANVREFSLSDRPRRLASVSRETPRPQRWFAMCAAVTVFFAAAMAAYLSVTAPVESFNDAVSGAESVDLFSEQIPITASDFAG
jgi:anti-sigma factor RsiW